MDPRRLLVVLLLTTTASLVPGPLRAQRVGDRVRVAQGPWVPVAFRDPDTPYREGRFQALSGDTLVMSVREHLLRIPLEEAGGFELGRVVGHRAERGALIGGGVGVAVGTAIAVARDENDRNRDAGDSRFFDDDQIGILVLTTAVGAGVGALVGYRQKKIRWVSEGRPRASLEMGISPAGRVGVTLRLPVR